MKHIGEILIEKCKELIQLALNQNKKKTAKNLKKVLNDLEKNNDKD
jgi:hypothetical protein